MKNFDLFKESVVKALGEVFENTKIITNKVNKNNGLILEGIVIIAPNRNLSPTIYLNGFYEQYLNGREFEDIIENIADIYNKNLPDEDFDVECFTDWNRVKENIVFTLVNYERNSDLLSQVPHMKFLDLAIEFKFLLPTESSESATILIRNEHLDFWNVSLNELYEVAKVNTPEKLEAELKNILSLIPELLGEELQGIPEAPMYVLTNTKQLNGSACILYENVLKRFADKIDSDLYILPSSVHECILLPVDFRMSKAELKEMVESVNATQLAPEEFLSDNVYYYDRKNCKIIMV